METININDIKYFLKQKVDNETAFMGVLEDNGQNIKVCMMFDLGNVKQGEVAIVKKDIITKRCQEGSCEILSQESFKKLIGQNLI